MAAGDSPTLVELDRVKRVRPEEPDVVELAGKKSWSEPAEPFGVVELVPVDAEEPDVSAGERRD